MMTWLKWLLLSLLGLALALVLLVVAAQTYYRLTPASLSAEAQTLLDETKSMAALTENGYRMLGLQAPEGVDPVAYGKCYEAIQIAQANASMTARANDDAASTKQKTQTYEEIAAAIRAQCGGGKPNLDAPKPPRDDERIVPGFDWSKLAALHGNTSHTLLRDRWRQVLDGGPRGAQPDPFLVTLPPYSVALQLEHLRLADFAHAWSDAKTDDERRQALLPIGRQIESLTQYANGTLLESMIGIAGVSRSLLVVQAAISQRPSLSPALAEEAYATALSAAKLQQAVNNAVGAEMQIAVKVNERVERFGMGDSLVNPIMDRLGRVLYDRNDTLNLMAMGYRDSQSVIASNGKKTFRDTRSYAYAASLGCPMLGEWGYGCLAFGRNPTGRIMATIAVPAYDGYGLRALDVLNLAAATRLTIEARSRGLAGESLASFVANAPSDMREMASGEAFAYDAAGKKLIVKLRTRSTVLGEGSFSMPL